VDFARAIARLGVARGVTAFQRFGYIERNGQSNLATPLGRWRVEPQPHQDLVDQVSPWIDRLRRAGSDKHAPASISRAVRNCEEGVLACCRGGRTPQRWQELLLALGGAEAQLVASPRFTVERNLQPLPQLSASWLQAADDGSVELRLALALAAQFGISAGGDLDWQDSVRHHFMPLGDSGRFRTGASGLVSDPRVVCSGKDLQRDALALVQRRVVEAGQAGQAHFPLAGFGGTQAALADVAAFITASVDDSRILGLARPLMAMRWKGFASPLTRPLTSTVDCGILPLYGILRLTHHPRPIPLESGQIQVRLDPAILARLAAGDLTTAIAVATRRLRASGLRPHFSQAIAEPALSLRLAASLAFPIADWDAGLLAGRLAHPVLQEPPTTPDEQTATTDFNSNTPERKEQT
jgi:CRISPR-associated protein Csx17